jgi:hypothetical protein
LDGVIHKDSLKEKGYETKKSNFDVRFTHRSSEELLYKEEFTGFI